MEKKEHVKPLPELQKGKQVSQKAVSAALLNSDVDASELLSGSTAGQGSPVRRASSAREGQLHREQPLPSPKSIRFLTLLLAESFSLQ